MKVGSASSVWKTTVWMTKITRCEIFIYVLTLAQAVPDHYLSLEHQTYVVMWTRMSRWTGFLLELESSYAEKTHRICRDGPRLTKTGLEWEVT